jgi:hypothetical protein
MPNSNEVIYCYECTHCYKSKRSKTGYICEMWGHDDFASSTVLDGFCHKAKLDVHKDLREQEVK